MKLLAHGRWWLAVPALGLLVLSVYVWPARRNYYGKLGEIDVRLDLPYVAGSSNPKQQLDLYLPQGRSRAFPLIVFVHGGYWSPLDRRLLQPLLGTHGNIGAAFARAGVGAAIIGYRQHPEVQRGDDSLDDIARAIRFARDMAPSWGADPRRLFVIGHSAGGHLVSLLGTDPRILQRQGVERDTLAGFVSVDGIFDLKSAFGYLTADQQAIMRKLFGPDDAALDEHSTTHHIRAPHPPMLFVDSTGDEALCLDAFRALRAELADTSSTARFIELEGIGHNEMIMRVGTNDDPLLPLLLELVQRPRSG